MFTEIILLLSTLAKYVSSIERVSSDEPLTNHEIPNVPFWDAMIIEFDRQSRKNNWVNQLG